METLQTRTIGQALPQMVRSDYTPTAGGAEAVRASILAAQRKSAADRANAYASSVFKRAAIPTRFADRRLETFVPHCPGAHKALADAQRYAADFADVLKNGRSMIFVGTVGSGKTHLASGIAHSIMERGHTALFSSVIAAVRSVKETYGKGNGMTESAAIAKLIEPDLLILDEVGVQFGSVTEELILFEIINGRYEHVRPTIIISNLAMEGSEDRNGDYVKGLRDYLGDRVIDRLREGGGKQITFDWASYRRQAA